MHARSLIDVASLVSLHSVSLVRQRAPLPDDALSEYWIASRCRLDAWGRSLRMLGHSETLVQSQSGPTLLALSEEIVLSEVLARVVAGVTHVCDAAVRADEAGPIGRNALIGCQDAHRRVRALTTAWWPSDSPKRRLFRSLEARAATWSDVLLAYVARSGDVDHLAIDKARLREYAYDSHAHHGASSEAAAELLRFSLNAAFSAATQPPACPELNARLAGSALGLFPPALFDSHGLARKPWMIRAERSAEEASTMIEKLLAGGTSTGPLPRPERWRL
ncbi:MAG: hypothetical protein AAFV43_09910 [Planctomycetota bacterium]